MPFVVRWPGGVRAGSTWDKPVCQTDFLATFSDMLDIRLGHEVGEDSDSFFDGLVGRDPGRVRVPMIHHSMNGRFAIRDGVWKLVMETGKLPRELYNLESDPGEDRNVLGDHPAVVERLEGAISEIVRNGRSTPGPSQSNDTPLWDDLVWMQDR